MIEIDCASPTPSPTTSGASGDFVGNSRGAAAACLLSSAAALGLLAVTVCGVAL